MTRACNGCAACCHIVGVADIGKPRFIRCPHQQGCGLSGSCSIYQRRPQSCADYHCAWLDNEWMPGEMRPDRTGVLWELSADAMGVCLGMCSDASKLDADLQRAFMRHMVVELKVSIVVLTAAGEMHMALAEGHDEEFVLEQLLAAGAASMARFAAHMAGSAAEQPD